MKNNPCTAADFLENIAEIVEGIKQKKLSSPMGSENSRLMFVAGYAAIENQIQKYRKLHSTGAAAGACQAVKEANEAAEGIKRETEKLRRMT